MPQSGLEVAPECVSAFNELKIKKKLKYVIYKISDDHQLIVVEETSEDGDWDNFRKKLQDAKYTDQKSGEEFLGQRYAVYDFNYDLASGEGSRSKITFIYWSPDEGSSRKGKMVYASSKEIIKNALEGIAADIQANNEDDLEYDAILSQVSKNSHR